MESIKISARQATISKDEEEDDMLDIDFDEVVSNKLKKKKKKKTIEHLF